MGRYILRRVLLMVPSIWAVGTLTFVLTRVLPGNAAEVYLGINADRDRIDEFNAAWGLDAPAWRQYLEWWLGLFRGDLGVSVSTRRPVIDVLHEALGATLQIALLAILFSVVLGLAIGVVSASRRNSVLDYIGRFTAVFFLSVPAFWVATLMVVLPAVWFGWTPARQWVPLSSDPLRSLSITVWPALAVGLATAGFVARFTRSAMLDVLAQDYVRTARAKGLGNSAIIWRHVLRNSLIPVVALVALQMGLILGGTVIVEQIFAIPGMGRTMLQAVSARDYNLVQGGTFIFAVWFMAISLLADLAYGALNPRIRYE